MDGGVRGYGAVLKVSEGKTCNGPKVKCKQVQLLSAKVRVEFNLV